MSIATTRIYRSLSDFLNTDMYAILPLRSISMLTLCGQCHFSVDSDNAPRIGHAVPDSRMNFTIPTPPKRVEVAVHTAMRSTRLSHHQWTGMSFTSAGTTATAAARQTPQLVP
jgi:hypothetical protein